MQKNLELADGGWYDGQPRRTHAGGEGLTTEEASLRTRQALLVKCLGKLIQYATEQGWEFTLGEGYITDPRRSRSGDLLRDGEHMSNSLHYQRLAQDLNLFVDGQWITSGDHHAWIDLAAFWEGLDPLCSSGRSFRDANHFSVRYAGKR